MRGLGGWVDSLAVGFEITLFGFLIDCFGLFYTRIVVPMDAEEQKFLEVAQLWESAKNELRRLRDENASMKRFVDEKDREMYGYSAREAQLKESYSMLQAENAELQLQNRNSETLRTSLEIKHREIKTNSE